MQFEGYTEVKPGLWYCEKDGTPWSNRNHLKSYLQKLNCRNKDYYSVSFNGYPKLWHLIVYEYFKGPIPSGMEVDHKDNQGSNNLINNLQLKTPKDNHTKQLKRHDNTSGYPGVSLAKKYGKFGTQLYVNNKKIFLGFFNDPQDAFICYLENKIYYHGWESILPII